MRNFRGSPVPSKKSPGIFRAGVQGKGARRRLLLAASSEPVLGGAQRHRTPAAHGAPIGAPEKTRRGPGEPRRLRMAERANCITFPELFRHAHESSQWPPGAATAYSRIPTNFQELLLSLLVNARPGRCTQQPASICVTVAPFPPVQRAALFKAAQGPRRRGTARWERMPTRGSNTTPSWHCPFCWVQGKSAAGPTFPGFPGPRTRGA